MFPHPIQGGTFLGLPGHSLFCWVKTIHAALGHTRLLGHFLTSLGPGHGLLSGNLVQGGTGALKVPVSTHGHKGQVVLLSFLRGSFHTQSFQDCYVACHTPP